MREALIEKDPVPEIVRDASALIACRPITGSEHRAAAWLCELFAREGWSFETQDVGGGRRNIFVAWGEPAVVFRTHYDVVPGAEHQFHPEWREENLVGRGACDALGIVATMIAVCRRLEAMKSSGFGLLLVVGEEDDGVGARSAAEWLRGRGIRYLINGEPTEEKVVSSQKGLIDFALSVEGVSCHSGYPELGIDANLRLATIICRLYEATWGQDDELGRGTITVGMIEGGSATNVVSGRATARGSIRVVTSVREVSERLESLVGSEAQVSVDRGVEPVQLPTVPGLATTVVAFFTDIPYFQPLGVPCLLFGPGQISKAHTGNESLSREEMKRGFSGYLHLYHHLSTTLIR